MKTRRSLLSTLILLLLVAVGPMWGQTLAPAVPAPVVTKSTLVIVIQGTVNGPPESVPFSGKVQIKATAVTDPDFGGQPSVHLAIDFLDVQGLGATTRTKFFAVEEDELMRRLVASDRIDLVFTIVPDKGTVELATVRSGLASLTLTFDGAGNLTAGTGSITNNPFAPNL